MPYAGLISCTGVTGRGGCYLDHAQNALRQVAALTYYAALVYYAADEADWYVSLNAPWTVGSHAKSRPEHLFREMRFIDHAHDMHLRSAICGLRSPCTNTLWLELIRPQFIDF